MKNPVVHFEIPYANRDRIVKFYQSAFGWDANILGEDMGNYVVVMTSDSDKNGPKKKGMINGGFSDKKMPDSIKHPSFVISVDNIDDAMKRIKEAGGKVNKKPHMISGVGKYLTFEDTEGNELSVLQPK